MGRSVAATANNGPLAPRVPRARACRGRLELARLGTGVAAVRGWRRPVRRRPAPRGRHRRQGRRARARAARRRRRLRGIDSQEWTLGHDPYRRRLLRHACPSRLAGRRPERVGRRGRSDRDARQFRRRRVGPAVPAPRCPSDKRSERVRRSPALSSAPLGRRRGGRGRARAGPVGSGAPSTGSASPPVARFDCCDGNAAALARACPGACGRAGGCGAALRNGAGACPSERDGRFADGRRRARAHDLRSQAHACFIRADAGGSARTEPARANGPAAPGGRGAGNSGSRCGPSAAGRPGSRGTHTRDITCHRGGAGYRGLAGA
jgi:hypothetical protein